MKGLGRRGTVIAVVTVLIAVCIGAIGLTHKPAQTVHNATLTSAQDTFTVGILQDADSLNPFVGFLNTSYEAYQCAYDYLINDSATNFSPTPGLALSWHESADQHTWTYKLRSGVHWSDGVPLTAADAAYTFNRIIHGSFEQTNYGNYVADIVSASAPNATTLVLKVRQPNPLMTHLLVPILPEHIWSHISESAVATFPNSQMIGSGPFILVQRKIGQFIKFRANPNYWGGTPHIKYLVFKVFQDEDSELFALRKGEVDLVDSIGANSFNSLIGQENIKTVNAQSTGFDEIGFNSGAALTTGQPIGNGNPALRNPKVRVALAWAIDRPLLVDRVLGTYGTAGDSFIPPIYPSEHYTPTSDAIGFSLDRASALLTAAGYPLVNGKRMTPGGSTMSLRLFGRSDSPSSVQVIQFVAAWFRHIGINVSVRIVSENELTQIVSEGDYDVFEWGWVVEPDPDYQMSVFTCGQRASGTVSSPVAGLSDSYFCDPAYDKLDAQQAVTVDPVKRAALVRAAERIVYDQEPYVVLWYANDLEAYRSDLFTGFVPQPYPNGQLVYQYGTYSYQSITPILAGFEHSSRAAQYFATSIIVIVVLWAGLWWAWADRRSLAWQDKE